MSDKLILESLMFELGDSSKKESNEFILSCPDEMYQEVKDKKEKYLVQLQDIEKKALIATKEVSNLNRKEQAKVLFTRYKDIASICFSILDNKEWKIKFINNLTKKYE